MGYRGLYRIRKEKDQLERKLDRLTDPTKVERTIKRIHELEAEENERLYHFRFR